MEKEPPCHWGPGPAPTKTQARKLGGGVPGRGAPFPPPCPPELPVWQQVVPCCSSWLQLEERSSPPHPTPPPARLQHTVVLGQLWGQKSPTPCWPGCGSQLAGGRMQGWGQRLSLTGLSDSWGDGASLALMQSRWSLPEMSTLPCEEPLECCWTWPSLTPDGMQHSHSKKGSNLKHFSLTAHPLGINLEHEPPFLKHSMSCEHLFCYWYRALSHVYSTLGVTSVPTIYYYT